jgi:hypothetical protein
MALLLFDPATCTTIDVSFSHKRNLVRDKETPKI